MDRPHPPMYFSQASLIHSEVMQLQARLAAALQSRNQLKTELETLKKSLVLRSNSTDCVFLTWLPIEIRNMIYKELLVNKLLSTVAALPVWDRHRDVKYGLHPQILRTSRQIYQEASHVLYNSNTFIIDCTLGMHYHDSGQDLYLGSPILRYQDNHSYITPAFRKVSQWKIIATTINLDFEDEYYPTEELVYLCRALSTAPLKSIEVLLLPTGIKIDIYHPIESYMYYKPSDVLQPFLFLRNLPSFKLGNLNKNRISRGRNRPPTSLKPVIMAYHQSQLEAEIAAIVKGNSRVVKVFKMFENLLNYSQLFERNEQFKEQMRPSWQEARHYSRSRNLYEEDDESSGYDDHDKGLIDSRINNPFKNEYPLHPIELKLALSSNASQINDSHAFSETRAEILQYLEPQYQRIAGQAFQVAEFFKQMKRQAAANPEISACFPEEDIIDGYDLVLEYSQAFVRDVPRNIRRNIRKQQGYFDLCYSTMPREDLIHRMSVAMEAKKYVDVCESGRVDLTRMLKLAIDDMDEQYLKIRKARKDLFVDDNRDYGDQIDLELWRCDEMILWDVPEPVIGPEKFT